MKHIFHFPRVKKITVLFRLQYYKKHFTVASFFFNFFICFSMLCISTIYAQDEKIIYDDWSYKESIKTIQVYREGRELSYPFINLNTDDKIVVSFDDLSNDTRQYYYSLIHCDANWQPSDISEFDYMEGFSQNPINDYSFSFNTLIRYVHYQVVIPNADVKIKLSGNYLVKIVDYQNDNELIATARFMVVEQKVGIEATAKQAIGFENSKYCQEIDFSIVHTNYPITNPFGDLQIVVSQNGRKDNQITDLKPLYVKENKLIYDYERENVFPAGNEFRFFDMKSVRYRAEHIDSIFFHEPIYHFVLEQDFLRSKKLYRFHNDINGKRLIKLESSNESFREADYVDVHFALPFEAPILGGNFYVFGTLSNWTFNLDNKLHYNYETKRYERTIRLKQGYYNYEYVFLKDKESVADATLTEASFYETENDYIIYVYHHDFSARYDKLIGIQVINTLRKY